MSGGRRAPRKFLPKKKTDVGLSPYFLADGKITKKCHDCIFNFHIRMYFDLIYVRRQILVIIQAFFGDFQPGRPQMEQDWAWPVEFRGQHIAQFISTRENFRMFDWYGIIKKSLTHLDNLIEDEQIELHPDQDPLPKLNNNQKKAKYVELAAAGFFYLKKEVFDPGNSMFDRYIVACRSWLTKSSGEDREIKQAALNIWKDKIDKLTARVKKVLDLQNWLLQVAEVFYDQPEGEPNEPLEDQLYQVLSRAYFILYWTPDQVPTDDFTNLVWKLFDFDLSFKKFTPPNGQKTWYDPEQLKKDHTIIKGSFGDLTKPTEEVGEPEIGEEPGEDKKPDTKHDLNMKVFQLLQDIHRELIWVRRQILIVIQLIYGNFDKQEFAWPVEDNGVEFDIKTREDLRPDQWNNSLEINLPYVLGLLNENQPVGQCVRLDKMTANQKNANYLEVALMGLDHLRRLILNNTFKPFKDFHIECSALLKTMPEGSEERNAKQAKLNELEEALKTLLRNFYEAVFEGLKLLKPVKNELINSDRQIDDLTELKNQLSKIYYQFHPILDQVPMRRFCDVAYEMFGWNWTIAVIKEKVEEQMELFEPLHHFRTRRYKELALREARGAREGGAAGGFP